MQEKINKTISFIRNLYEEQEAFIPLHEPRFVGNDKAYVLDAIESTFVSSVGEYVNRFEVDLAAYTKSGYAVATMNGTAALHMALMIAGVKPGEEVITQALTFVATANAISYCHAKPVFVDVDLDTLGMSPDALQSFLEEHTEMKNGLCINKRNGKRIGACLPMHTFGIPCRIDEIGTICKNYGIPVVEDAAESLGTFYKKKHTGTFGGMGTISLNGNKTITSGGGGAIITDDQEIAKKAKHLTTTAKMTHPWEYKHDQIAYNYRMPNLNAALACAQLEKLPDFIEIKFGIAEKYRAFFSALDITMILPPTESQPNHWLNALLLADKKERDQFLAETNKNGIMTRPIWTLMCDLPMYKDCQSDRLENSRYLQDRIVNIPSSVII